MSLPVGFFGGWIGLPRHLVPALVTLLMLVCQLLPWTQSSEAIMPSLVLMSLVFWTLRAPRLYPLFFAFVAGLLADLAELTPLGAQAAVFLGLALYLRRYVKSGPQPFLHLWATFAASMLVANTALWLIEILIGGHLLPAAPVLTRSAVALAVFPLVTYAVLFPSERLIGHAADG